MKQSELMNILDDVATGKVTKEEALLARVCLKLFMAQEKLRNK